MTSRCGVTTDRVPQPSAHVFYDVGPSAGSSTCCVFLTVSTFDTNVLGAYVPRRSEARGSDQAVAVPSFWGSLRWFSFGSRARVFANARRCSDAIGWKLQREI